MRLIESIPIKKSSRTRKTCSVRYQLITDKKGRKIDYPSKSVHFPGDDEAEIERKGNELADEAEAKLGVKVKRIHVIQFKCD